MLVAARAVLLRSVVDAEWDGRVAEAVGIASRPAGLHNIFIFPAIDPPAEGRYLPSVAVFDMKPQSRGSVRPSLKIRGRRSRSTHGFLSAPRGAEVISEGRRAVVRRLAEMMLGAGRARQRSRLAL